jgi:hypothetical protein
MIWKNWRTVAQGGVEHLGADRVDVPWLAWRGEQQRSGPERRQVRQQIADLVDLIASAVYVEDRGLAVRRGRCGRDSRAPLQVEVRQQRVLPQAVLERVGERAGDRGLADPALDRGDRQHHAARHAPHPQPGELRVALLLLGDQLVGQQRPGPPEHPGLRGAPAPRPRRGRRGFANRTRRAIAVVSRRG